MKWSVIAAVNNERVLESCLLNSPGIKSAVEVILQKGYRSAPEAYNAAIEKATTDLLVFVHQDVYLPENWFDSVQKAIETLTRTDPGWGVLGVWGAIDSERRAGYLYWTGEDDGGSPFEGVKEIKSLDEVVLVFRKSSGLRFDVRLPGYHMYGADICTEAIRRGKKCYAISAFCIHNTNIGGFLPLQFWKCYLFMRWKWRNNLPIYTPCTQVTFWCWPMFRWNLAYAKNWALGRQKEFARVGNPRLLHQQLIDRGLPCAEGVREASQAE